MRNRFSIHTILFLLLFSAVVSVSSGCRTSDSNNPTGMPTAPVTASPLSPSPVPSLSPTPTPTLAPTAVPTPTPTPEPTVRDTFTPSEYNYVYSFSEGFGEDITFKEMCSCGDRILLMCERADEFSPVIISFNPANGEFVSLLLEDIGPYTYSIYPINDNQFVIFDYEAYTYHIFDNRLNEANTFNINEEIYMTGSFDPDGDIVYYSDMSRNTLIAYNYLNNTHTDIYTDENIFNDSHYYNSKVDPKYLTVYSFDDEIGDYRTHIIDTDEAALVFSDQSYDSFIFAPDYSEYLVLQTAPFYSITLCEAGKDSLFELKNEPVTTFRITDTDETYRVETDWESRCIITTSSVYSDNDTMYEYRCYSMETGECISSYVFTSDLSYGWSSIAFDPTEKLLYSGIANSSPFSLYAWDYLEDDVDSTDNTYLRYGVIPEYLDEHRKAIESKYGIYIYLGNEIASTTFDYNLSVCKDYEKMDSVLTTLENVLNLYPENLFRQLKVNGIKSLAVYLCGGFTKIYDYSADNAIALASTIGYERSLSLDVYADYCMEQNIVHELSHWIDTKINSESGFGKCVDFEVDWLDLNPSSFSYKYSYVSGKNYSKYVFDSSKPESAYFIDLYSQTYPTEDRARLFEYLMYNDSDLEYMSSANIRAKLRYYFEAIREAFDTEGWPEKTLWEEKLDEYEEMYNPTIEEEPVSEDTGIDSTEIPGSDGAGADGVGSEEGVG